MKTDYWSKVMHVTKDEPEIFEQHIVVKEVGRQQDLRVQNKRSVIPPWSFVFSPQDFKEQHECSDIESWRLNAK